MGNPVGADVFDPHPPALWPGNWGQSPQTPGQRGLPLRNSRSLNSFGQTSELGVSMR